MGRLDGKTAVITGGNSGMGRATAEAMAREGARVMIFGRNDRTLAETQQAIGPACVAVRGDIGELADLDRLADTARREFGKIDIVFANAGGGHEANFFSEDVTEEIYEGALRANLKGKFFTITKLVPLMPPGGSILLTGGITNHAAIPKTALLSIVQSSARALARSLAVELAPKGLRVNTICPGFIYGPVYDGMDMDAIDREYVQRIPLKRMGQGADIANAAIYLGSDEAAYVTGTELVVDGGHTLPI